jgi:hypothetical protein
MNRWKVLEIGLCLGLVVLSRRAAEGGRPACRRRERHRTALPGAVEQDMDPNNVKVDHPEQFPTVAAGVYLARRN